MSNWSKTFFRRLGQEIACSSKETDAVRDAYNEEINFLDEWGARGDDKEEECGELLKKAVRFIESQRKRTDQPGVRAQHKEIEYTPSLAELEAASIWWLRLMRSIGSLQRVKEFRKVCLPSYPLKTDEANALKRSPLATVVPLWVLDQYNVPPTSKEWLFKPLRHWRQYRYEVEGPEGLHISALYDHEDLLRLVPQMSRDIVQVVVGAVPSQIFLPEDESFAIPRVNAADDRQYRAIDLFLLPHPTDNVHVWCHPLPSWIIENDKSFKPFGFKNTLMGNALQLASDITQAWQLDTDHILDWLLTGYMRYEQPVRTSLWEAPLLDQDGRIEQTFWSSVNITAMPWVTAESVERQFMQATKFVYDKGENTRTNSKRNRLPTSNTLQIYRSVAGEDGEIDRTKSWRERCDRFYREHSKRYEPDPFQQQYDRAKKFVDLALLPQSRIMQKDSQGVPLPLESLASIVPFD